MTPAGFLHLMVESVGAPRSVARFLLSANLSREAILTSFAAVIVVNAVVFGASLLAAPAPDGVPFFLATPAGYLATQTVTLGGSILFFTWSGRLLGGAGRMADMALLLIWLQALNIAVQLATILLLAVSAQIGGIFVLVTTGIGFWILLNFIDEAHGLGSLGRAFFVFLLGLLGLGFALSLLLSFAGVTPEGIMGNV